MPGSDPGLKEYLPKTAEDAADEGGATALIEADSPDTVATRLATSWSIRASCSGEKIVVSSAPAPSEVPATVDITR